MTAYYNEIDPDAAYIMRTLIDEGVLAPGDVDTRSIKDVHPDDLRPYTQCHFFAGGGLWSVAARLAGWPDDRELWTGSCPCQPFSIAGKGGGVDDARHLWPDFFRLISARRPAVVVGEQVAGQAGYGWLDGVRADLAGEAYASRGVDIPACAVDAPHIRSRLYWCALDVAHSVGKPASAGAPIAIRGSEEIESQRQDGRNIALGDAECARLEGQRGDGDRPAGRSIADRSATEADGSSGTRDMDDAQREGLPRRFGSDCHLGTPRKDQSQGVQWERLRADYRQPDGPYRRNGSFWADHEWIACHDGKARRAQPGVSLLVDGLPGRVGLWRVAGNAISPVLAAEVIGALMDDLADSRPESGAGKQIANKPSLSESMSENMSGDMSAAAKK